MPKATWNGAVLAASAGDFSRPDNGPFASATFFQVTAVTGGYKVDAALTSPETRTAEPARCRSRMPPRASTASAELLAAPPKRASAARSA